MTPPSRPLPPRLGPTRPLRRSPAPPPESRPRPPGTRARIPSIPRIVSPSLPEHVNAPTDTAAKESRGAGRHCLPAFLPITIAYDKSYACTRFSGSCVIYRRITARDVPLDAPLPGECVAIRRRTRETSRLMRHHDRLWRTRRHISPRKPANEPGRPTSEPEKSTDEPDGGTNEPGICERTRGGTLSHRAGSRC